MLTKPPAFEPIDRSAQPRPGFGRRDEHANQADYNSDHCDTYADKGEHILFRPRLVTGSRDGPTRGASNKRTNWNDHCI